MDGDTLRITGTALSAMEFFTSGDEAAVTIGIPEDASLDAVDIHTAMGQVELGGFTANSLTVSTDLGNVSLDSVMASDADITLSMGDLTGYSLTTTDSLTVKNDMGDVYLDGDFQGIRISPCPWGIWISPPGSPWIPTVWIWTSPWVICIWTAPPSTAPSAGKAAPTS